jgi:hypothetical protein
MTRPTTSQSGTATAGTNGTQAFLRCERNGQAAHIFVCSIASSQTRVALLFYSALTDCRIQPLDSEFTCRRHRTDTTSTVHRDSSPTHWRRSLRPINNHENRLTLQTWTSSLALARLYRVGQLGIWSKISMEPAAMPKTLWRRIDGRCFLFSTCRCG